MTAIAKLQSLLGGESITGSLKSELDIVRLVRRGIPSAAVECFLATTRLGFGSIETHVLARRTYNRRRDAGQCLDPIESDRLVRLARLVGDAEETFDDVEKAHKWLARPSHALGGETPLSLADTHVGALQVEGLLGQIAHGLAA